MLSLVAKLYEQSITNHLQFTQELNITILGYGAVTVVDDATKNNQKRKYIYLPKCKLNIYWVQTKVYKKCIE